MGGLHVLSKNELFYKSFIVDVDNWKLWKMRKNLRSTSHHMAYNFHVYNCPWTVYKKVFFLCKVLFQQNWKRFRWNRSTKKLRLFYSINFILSSDKHAMPFRCYPESWGFHGWSEKIHIGSLWNNISLSIYLHRFSIWCAFYYKSCNRCTHISA